MSKESEIHGQYFDALETRSADERARDLSRRLPKQISLAQSAVGYSETLAGINPEDITSLEHLGQLPVLRKSDLIRAQQANPPFGGFTLKRPSQFAHIFQSPGPIYEPGDVSSDWWRLGRFLHAVGIGSGDIVQNCFSYHLTPAGMIFENAARAVGAAVVPAGIGQTELQVMVAQDVGVTAYAGTPDYLKTLLNKADELDVKLGISKAAVGGGALLSSTRTYYAERGIMCLQNYATADLGNIAYESSSSSGLIIDEHVIVEIVTPGTGDVVAPGEVGEVVVTTLNPNYPLIRFATGDLSAFLDGQSPCGRTNQRIKGWMGRADQSTKVKGLFVRPEQVAQLVASHPDIKKARVVVGREMEIDTMVVKIETNSNDSDQFSDLVSRILRLRGMVDLVQPGHLPSDGIVIEDQRSFD